MHSSTGPLSNTLSTLLIVSVDNYRLLDSYLLVYFCLVAFLIAPVDSPAAFSTPPNTLDVVEAMPSAAVEAKSVTPPTAWEVISPAPASASEVPRPISSIIPPVLLPASLPASEIPWPTCWVTWVRGGCVETVYRHTNRHTVVMWVQKIKEDSSLCGLHNQDRNEDIGP